MYLTADMTKDKSKEIALIAFMLTVIVGVVSWKLLSTHQFFIMFTALFTGLITFLIFHLNTVKRTVSTITMAMNSTVKRVANINYWYNDKLRYVAAVVVISLWLASSVFVGTKILFTGLCLGGIVIVYYIKPYNSHLTVNKIYHEIYPLLAICSGTTVFVFIMLLTMGLDWEIIIFLISIITLLFCFFLCFMVFVLLVV